METINQLLEKHLLETLEEGDYFGGYTFNDNGKKVSIGSNSFIKAKNQILKMPSNTVISEFYLQHK